MQFIMYDPNFDLASAPPPTPEMMEQMGAFIGEAMASGVLVATGATPAEGTRLRYSGGEFAVTDDQPIAFTQLTGGFAVIEVASPDEAVEWAKRFRQIVGEGESEIVPVLGPGDMG